MSKGRRSYPEKNKKGRESSGRSTEYTEQTEKKEVPAAKTENRSTVRSVSDENTPKKRSKGGKRVFREDVEKTKKEKKTLRTVLIIAAVVVVLAGSAVAVFKSIVKRPDVPSKTDSNVTIEEDGQEEDLAIDAGDDSSAERSHDSYTFLLAGTDKVADNTDTILIIKYDVTDQVINVMSVPRDTCINVSWGVKKINSAYGNGGIDQLKKELKKILGFSVDYYMIVDLEAFQKIVDTIGGVDFDVPVNMNYYDPTQDLNINISAGMQHLNGEQALKVARFRSGYSNADIGRISTQQDLLKAIAKQTLKVSNLTKVGDFVKIFKEYVETDLTLGELTWLATQMMSVDTENDVHFFTLPCNTSATIKGLSYVTIYVNDLVEMVNEYFNPYDTPITADNLNILTLDSHGNIYATNGTIAGPFADYSSVTGLGTSTGGESKDNDPENLITAATYKPSTTTDTSTTDGAGNTSDTVNNDSDAEEVNEPANNETGTDTVEGTETGTDTGAGTDTETETKTDTDTGTSDNTDTDDIIVVDGGSTDTSGN